MGVVPYTTGHSVLNISWVLLWYMHYIRGKERMSYRPVSSAEGVVVLKYF